MKGKAHLDELHCKEANMAHNEQQNLRMNEASNKNVNIGVRRSTARKIKKTSPSDMVI